MKPPVFLGLDFGTESVRALLVDLHGRERGSAVSRYRHGQILENLPGRKQKLPRHSALQHPLDWIESAGEAVRQVRRVARCKPDDIHAIGVDFTSCTMLPARADGTPLCLLPKFANVASAWPKLWKHHGAEPQARRITALAQERREPWLSRYGGAIGLEWFFPKMLETLEATPRVFAATDVWLEAGDWFVWQLVGGPASNLPRSTCQAGYKAMWSRSEGFPSPDYFRALDPRLENVVAEKIPGRFLAPGECAGFLRAEQAAKLGLRPGIPVSAAVIDAHAGVPGSGAAEAGTLVMVLGTSSCHMLNALENHDVPGVAGIVQDGILPGLVGYETGQAAVGDAFDWLRRVLGQKDFAFLDKQASALPPGAEGVLCLDWLNGCRTPLMDGGLAGGFTGLTLSHGPAHLYRALLEASAFGLRWIVELLRQRSVPVKRFVATGGLAHRNRLLLQIYADVLGAEITVPPSKQGPALGAAILGALAAGKSVTGISSVKELIGSMASPSAVKNATILIRPHRRAVSDYAAIYRRYRELGDFVQRCGGGASMGIF